MWLNVFIGIIMIIITTIIHSLLSRFILFLNRVNLGTWCSFRVNCGHLWISLIAIIIFFTTIFEALIWMGCYLFFDIIDTPADALYFSIVTLTTLGYGDIVLVENWRLLSSMQAVNGVIILGWSTALLIATVQRIHLR